MAGQRGHRTVPHTADVRVEAWAPTRDECVAEAVLAAVETYVDTSGVHAQTAHEWRLPDSSDEDLLVAVLDEVIYLSDATSRVPVDIEIVPDEEGVEVRLDMVDVTRLPQTGAVPKGVSLHGLRLAAGPEGWSCSVTLDV